MSTLLDQLEANRQEMIDKGYTLINLADKRQAHFDRLVGLVHVKYHQYFPFMRSYFIKVPQTEMSIESTYINRTWSETHVLVTGVWCPTWMLDIVDLERQWRADCVRGTANADDHERLVDALYAGLSGNFDQLDMYLGMRELVNEYKREHGPRQLAISTEWSFDPNTGISRVIEESVVKLP